MLRQADCKTQRVKLMREEQKINMSIEDGESFFCHEVSINFNPTQFILDFKNITPRIDPRNVSGPTIVMKHNVVVTDPFHTKKVYELLGGMLKKYENEFGKIKEPDAYKNLKKRMKKEEGRAVKDAPAYFG